MTEYEDTSRPSWYEDIQSDRRAMGLNKLTPRELSHKISEGLFSRIDTVDGAYIMEAKERLERYDRFQKLLGLLAPAGTAPRSALEQLYIQSETNADESQIVLDLRNMLAQHWGDWTPALREAEGIPPEVAE